MPFTTAITHYVRGDVLQQWLSTTFGSVETGTWSFKEIAYGQDGFWQVTAPRVITAGEQTQLELDSRPTRVRTFGN